MLVASRTGLKQITGHKSNTIHSPLCSIAPLANEAERINLIMQTVINNIVVAALCVIQPQKLFSYPHFSLDVIAIKLMFTLLSLQFISFDEFFSFYDNVLGFLHCGVFFLYLNVSCVFSIHSFIHYQSLYSCFHLTTCYE